MNKEDRWVEELFEAVRRDDLKMVRELVSMGANVNVRDNYGQTPLHVAAKLGSLKIIEYLISKGADINCEDESGYTPIQLAMIYKNYDVVQFLLSHVVDLDVAILIDILEDLHILADFTLPGLCRGSSSNYRDDESTHKLILTNLNVDVRYESILEGVKLFHPFPLIPVYLVDIETMDKIYPKEKRKHLSKECFSELKYIFREVDEWWENEISVEVINRYLRNLQECFVYNDTFEALGVYLKNCEKAMDVVGKNLESPSIFICPPRIENMAKKIKLFFSKMDMDEKIKDLFSFVIWHELAHAYFDTDWTIYETPWGRIIEESLAEATAKCIVLNKRNWELIFRSMLLKPIEYRLAWFWEIWIGRRNFKRIFIEIGKLWKNKSMIVNWKFLSLEMVVCLRKRGNFFFNEFITFIGKKHFSNFVQFLTTEDYFVKSQIRHELEIKIYTMCGADRELAHRMSGVFGPLGWAPGVRELKSRIRRAVSHLDFQYLAFSMLLLGKTKEALNYFKAAQSNPQNKNNDYSYFIRNIEKIQDIVNCSKDIFNILRILRGLGRFEDYLV